MEKYSAFRDPGTGIQPFLNPVPPNAPTLLANLLLPLRYIVGSIRVVLVLLVALLYILLVEIAVKVFYPIAPLHGLLSGVLTAVLARLALILVGLWWIPVTHISRKRGRGVLVRERWNPRAGDVIVSNWCSWIEILYLSFRFNPAFVLPVTGEISRTPSQSATPTSSAPGRRTGTGSAAIASPASRPPTSRAPILGFQVVSLLQMVRLTGRVSPFRHQPHSSCSLESIRKENSRPIVLFPECTTSNGRGMLRFAEVFGTSTIPVRDFRVFVMCVRYDPPTLHTPTLTCPIPSSSAFNPLPQIFRVASSLSPALSQSLSLRLLNPGESPSSGNFLASDVLANGGYKDELAEACSVLIAQLGKMKVTGQGWEDKVAFLEFYRSKAGR